MRAPALPLALALALSAGCGFQTVASSDDLAGADLAGADFSGVDFSGGPDLPPPDCTLPGLLAAVEDLNDTPGNGEILRFNVQAGVVTLCKSYRGSGVLPAQPLAVAWIPSIGIAAASPEALMVLNDDDSVRWSYSIDGANLLPVDVFPMKDMSGAQLIAVGYWHQFSTDIEVDEVDAHGDSGNAPLYTWPTDGTHLPLQFSVAGITASALAPTHFFALVTEGSSEPAAAWDVNAFGNTKALYAPDQPAYNLASIATYIEGSAKRTVWIDTKSNGLVYSDDVGGGASVQGPIIPSTSTCMLVYAVPDPTVSDGYLALCEPSTTSPGRNLIRVAHSGAMTTVYAGAQLPSMRRFTRLGLILTP